MEMLLKDAELKQARIVSSFLDRVSTEKGLNTGDLANIWADTARIHQNSVPDRLYAYIIVVVLVALVAFSLHYYENKFNLRGRTRGQLVDRALKEDFNGLSKVDGTLEPTQVKENSLPAQASEKDEHTPRGRGQLRELGRKQELDGPLG